MAAHLTLNHIFQLYREWPISVRVDPFASPPKCKRAVTGSDSPGTPAFSKQDNVAGQTTTYVLSLTRPSDEPRSDVHKVAEDLISASLSTAIATAAMTMGSMAAALTVAVPSPLRLLAAIIGLINFTVRGTNVFRTSNPLGSYGCMIDASASLGVLASIAFGLNTTTPLLAFTIFAGTTCGLVGSGFILFNLMVGILAYDSASRMAENQAFSTPS